MAAEAPARTATGGTDARRAAELKELVDQVGRDFAERDALYGYVDAVIHGTLKGKLPKGYAQIGRPQHNPLAVYFTNTITAALTVDPPATRFPVPAPGGAAAQLNATLREHFFDASWARQEEEAEADVFRRFAHSVVCKGEGILKTVPRTAAAWASYRAYAQELARRLSEGDLRKLDDDAKDRLYDARTEEYKRVRAPYPIRSTDVTPETFRYWKGEDGLTLAIEHKRVPYLETLARFGLALDRSGGVVKVDQAALGQALPAEDWASAMSGVTTLTMDEVWRWNTCEYVVTGPGQSSPVLVRTYRHRFGDPVTKSLRGPYAHCLGTTTASRLPHRAGLGVLYGFLDLFVMLDELLTVQQINAVLTGLASFKRNRPPNAGLPDSEYGEDGRLATRQPVKIEPGYVFPDDVGPLEMPRAGEALPLRIAQVREFLELILPKVLQGVVDTTDSGYQLALAARLGRIAFDPMVKNLRRAFARRTGFESFLIEEVIGETVYAQGTPPARPGEARRGDAGVLALGPQDLRGLHAYQCDLQPEDKASELVEVRKHAEMVKEGFEDVTQAIEALGGNPEEVEFKRTVTQMKQDPEIQAQLRQRILRKVAARQEQQVTAGQEALAQVAPVPEPGAALGGMGEVFEGGQNLPVAPGGPGVLAQPAQAGGLPAAIPGQPGAPPAVQQAALGPAGAGFGV